MKRTLILWMFVFVLLGLSVYAGPCTVDCAIQDDLVAYYKFETDTNNEAFDSAESIGSNINHTYSADFVNTPTLDTVQFQVGSGSYDFVEADEDNLKVLDNVTLYFGDSMSIAFWIFADQLNPDNAIITKNDGTIEFAVVGDGGTARLKGKAGGGQKTTVDPGYTTSAWVQIIMIYNGSADTADEELKVFIDGVQDEDTSDNVDPGDTLSDTGSNICIAWDCVNAGRYFDGNIDELLIWNRTLLAREINCTFDAGTAGEEITQNHCAEVVPDTTPTNLTLINLTSEGGFGQIVYNNSNEDLGKLTGLPRTNDTTPTYHINTSEAATCSIYSSPRLNLSNTSDILLMTFDENTSDLSTFGNDGNVSGGVTHLPNGGYIGGAYLFDGVDDFINISGTDSLNFEITDSFTLEAWVKTTGSGTIIDKVVNSPSRKGYTLEVRGNGVLSSFIYSSSDNNRRRLGSVILNDGEWHHMAMVYNGDSSFPDAYVDGQLDNADTESAGSMNTITNVNPMKIGKNFGTAFFGGTIDEIVISDYAKTALQINDSFKFGISPNMNHSLSIKQVPERLCSTTGGTHHVCTVAINDTLSFEDTLRTLSNSSQIRTGLASTIFSCKDSIGNELSTATSTNEGISSFSYFNLTDFIAPNTTQYNPFEGDFYIIGINNTLINFTTSSIDNLDENFTLELQIDGNTEFTNTTYNNGTNVSYFFTISSLGTHTWSVLTTDSYNNVNQSPNVSFTVEQDTGVVLFLNDVNGTRKYEYRSVANLTANCTSELQETCQVEIDLQYPGFSFNFSFGDNQTSFLFNITLLRLFNFSNDGPGKVTLTEEGSLNVTSNNNTQIVNVTFNVTSDGVSTNVNITHEGVTKFFRGSLRTKYLENNRFIENKEEKEAVNITFLTGGSAFIFSNVTDLFNPINISFDLSGFNLDGGNDFTYTEFFNGTDGSVPFNSTLTYQADAPAGIFDDFQVNTTIWSSNNIACVLAYEILSTRQVLKLECKDSQSALFDYADEAADFRNTSYINLLFKISQSVSDGTATAVIFATDGTSNVELFRNEEAGTGSSSSVRNMTLRSTSADFKSWEVTGNVTNRNVDLSLLDFEKQIKLRFQHGTSGSGDTSTFLLRRLDWGGAWLNRSTNNGTYKSEGNITSGLINKTKNNLIKATLTAIDYQPTGTSIGYFLSNTCNATKPTFEPVTSGITHTFGTVGNHTCWRANMSSSINTTSPVIRIVRIDIINSTAENITVDLNDDGTNEFTFIGLLDEENSPLFVNLTPLPNQINTIKISSATSGIIQVDNFRLNATINPVTFNDTVRSEDCSNCLFNFSFGGDNLLVEDLKWDFLGSLNITATARYLGNKINQTIQIYYSFFNTTLANNLDFYDVFASSGSQTNLTPFGQRDDNPIWNLTNLAYDEPLDIYVRTNESFACFNVTYGNNSNRSASDDTNFILNQSYQKILANISTFKRLNFTSTNESINVTMFVGFPNSTFLNHSIEEGSDAVRNASIIDRLLVRDAEYTINYTTGNFTLLNVSFNDTLLYITYNFTEPNINSKSIWNWWDLYSCSNRFEIPYVYFSAQCSDCVFDERNLDLFNLIIE